MSLFGATLSVGSLFFFSERNRMPLHKKGLLSATLMLVSDVLMTEQAGGDRRVMHFVHLLLLTSLCHWTLYMHLFFVADDKNNHIAQSHAGKWLSQSVSFRIPDCDLLIIKELFCRRKNYKAGRQGKYKEHEGSASWYTDWRKRASLWEWGWFKNKECQQCWQI